ncbi:hypothetical protein GCM10008013_38390 [Paenibacillus segetis]|uniref:GP-PDE domain-containing protein n=2 Tax=Paenibacillus segetis TaxID=1325360 RepID=A0ABQ1YQP4_9BACL|nr:hypothetical protein GCM10008013_38390 [Paenibacillus segetis]
MRPKSNVEAEGFKAHRMVAHAMGGINGIAYSNTYEAFIANYEKGLRIFEVDLLLSTDNDLIARHEWSENMTKLLGQQDELEPDRQGTILTSAEFKAAKIMGQYEPLNWGEILDLMEFYPDVYIVTDTKQIKTEEIDQIFGAIVESAKAKDPVLLERIVPQIYNQSMWEQLQGIHPFESIIFTLYTVHDTDKEVLQFVEDKGITAVTMSETRANKGLIASLNKIGVPSYVHTINDTKIMKKFQRMGAYGFYTDFLTEDDAKHSGWLDFLGL